jgi:hypothetical protein
MTFPKDLLARFTSRKFLLAITGVVVALGVHLSDAQLTAMTALIVAFTAAEGTADILGRK